MVTWTFNSQDKSHRALDEQLYLLPSGWDDCERLLNEWKLRKINQGQSIATQRPYRYPLVGEWSSNRDGEGGDHVSIFIKLHFVLTEITQQQQKQNKPQQASLSDKNQIITGVTYALSAWYFNLAF